MSFNEIWKVNKPGVKRTTKNTQILLYTSKSRRAIRETSVILT
jgi:hypothetical protein